MNHEEVKRLAIRFFEAAKFAVEEIPESIDKTADLRAIADDGKCWLIEVKEKSHDENDWSQLQSQLLSNECVARSESHHRRNTIAGIFEDANKQLTITATGPEDFRIVWIGFDGHDIDLRWQQVFATFYGAVYISSLLPHRTSHETCYYFDHSASFAYPEIDALVICDGNSLQFCANEFSTRFKSLRESQFYRDLDRDGAVHDPLAMAEKGVAVLLRSDVTRSNEELVLKALELQEGVKYAHVRIKRHSVYSAIRNPS